MNLLQEIKSYFLSDQDKRRLLKNILGFYPKNLSLYKQAFIHRSLLANETLEKHECNERLEFLGDAILGTVVSDYLYKKFPFANEGFLTKMRSKVVSRKHLNELAFKLDLDRMLVKSPGVTQSKSIYGDAFEAFIGAIYIDKGYKATKNFVINKVIKDCIDIELLVNKETNFKSKLIEKSQKDKEQLEFQTFESGEEGARKYCSEIYLNQEKVATGVGQSKKEAEQAASENYFSAI